MLTREQFLQHLRDALNHLHDPNRLPKSPLAVLFGVANRPDAFFALQHIVIKAVEALEPNAQEPTNSRAWRIHDALFYRYVEGFSPQQVADQLGIGVRHLRREQRAAQEALAHLLWHQFELDAGLSQEQTIELIDPQTTRKPLEQDDELAWLKDMAEQPRADLDQVLGDVVDLAQVLCQKHNVTLHAVIPEAPPKVPAHPVALNQILLNLIGVAIHRSPSGTVLLTADAVDDRVEIQIRAQPPDSPAHTTDDDVASLDMAHRLIKLCGGTLALSDPGSRFSAALVLPALEQITVLAVDDNADTLQLLQRYTSGTRYRLVGTQDPNEALRMAEELSPRAIVLDVMMPQVDGWKILALLRQQPKTGHIPIIVCTILAQQDLAFALDAGAFIKKPVTQQALLAVLDGQIAGGGAGPLKDSR